MRLTPHLFSLGAAVCSLAYAGCEERDAADDAERPLESVADESVWITTDRDALPTLSRVYSATPEVYGLEGTSGPVAVSVPRSLLPELSEAAHEEHNRCGGFMLHGDEEEALEFVGGAPSLQNQVVTGSYRIDNAETANALTGALREQNILATITKLSSFTTRHHASPTGTQASQWIRDTWASFGAGRSDVTAALVKHTRTGQPSVSLTIRGSKLPNEHVILGGHLDSIAGRTATATAPGADDNASGIAALTEVARAVLALGLVPERTVTFYGYAAEEVGLVGSGEIAANAKTQKLQVAGVMQLDMTNFNSASQQYIAFMTDYTDPNLTSFAQKLVETYVKVPWKTDKCGYACSDHASWTQRGYPAIMPHEANMRESNKRIHTPNDTLALSQNNARHALSFSKLAAAFVAELAKGKLEKPAAAAAP